MTIFGSQLHTHATGTKVVTRHFRDERELPEVNRDDHYSTHFQEIRVLREPRRIMPVSNRITLIQYNPPTPPPQEGGPLVGQSAVFRMFYLVRVYPTYLIQGDNLVTTCWHDTTSRSNVTLGGYGFGDEMCVNYVHYYPR